MNSKGRYGAPKIHKQKKKEKFLEMIPSLKRVHRLMRNMGLFTVVIKRCKYKNNKTTNKELPNLLNQDFKITGLNQMNLLF